MKYEEAYRWAVASLKELNIDEAEIDSWFALEDITGISRGMWYVKNIDEMPDDMYAKYVGIIERLKKREPLSYILGSRDFCGFNFFVNENVLIPRQDTENLVLRVVEDCAVFSKTLDEIKIHDLCTGSGCIAVSVKKFLDKRNISAKVSASDISDGALMVAKSNAERLEAFVDIFKSDMFNSIDGCFDIIISNPPYIPIEQYLELDAKVKDYEPRLALVGDDNGLYFYRVIAKEAKRFLRPGGRLYLEIGFDQGKSVPEILANEGYRNIEVYKDYNNLDRNVVAVMDGL